MTPLVFQFVPRKSVPPSLLLLFRSHIFQIFKNFTR
ncbi:hypothetical protein V1478_010098 [Vespula squamosa]|uniref:Uncharacterized protein n=1 Tax=Vespula squamosa TaxID=30214 RepID=A0ABD2AIS2_VESSQ